MKIASNYLKSLTRNTILNMRGFLSNRPLTQSSYFATRNFAHTNEKLFVPKAGLCSQNKFHYSQNSVGVYMMPNRMLFTFFGKKNTTGLNKEKLEGIAKGLSREDVIALNEAQIDALVTLKPYGLKAHHLRDQSWFDSVLHKEALMSLMTSLGWSPGVAMQEIHGLSETDALCIGNRGLFHETFGLNTEQIKALVALTHRGLEVDDLRNQEWFFDYYHTKALIFLMAKRDPLMSAKEAIEELRGLDLYQAKGIAKGLSREEITELSEIQINTLIALKAHGLEGEHLRGQYWLNFYHERALRFLLVEREPIMSPERAMQELHSLDYAETLGIINGISRDEVIGLNEFKVRALIELKPHGISGDHLRDQHWFCNIIYTKALLFLITKRDPMMSPERAIQELHNLNQTEAFGISEGLSVEELRGLNRAQIEALIALKFRGLSHTYLRGKDWFRSREHKYALELLMLKGNLVMSAEKAMEELDGLNQEQAGGIYRGLSREEVLGLDMEQINALLDLKRTPANRLSHMFSRWF